MSEEQAKQETGVKDVLCSSKMSADFRLTTWHYVTEAGSPCSQHCVNLKSNKEDTLILM
jgi:hypothetical protein